ncbi:MAG: hypothetical protein GX992_03555 [Clostridium sp.]|nr:hypothetical protein [Clostridium sp.]
MTKKISMIIIAIMLTFGLCNIAFASRDNALIFEGNIMDTEQFLVTITRPEGDETTFKESYVLCGNSGKENITVQLLMYNEWTGKFEPFCNIDGEDTWKIGASGFFMKEIRLPKAGANKIRLVAYADTPEKLGVYTANEELVLGTNLQVNTFTVTLLKKSIQDSIKNGFFRISDMLNRLFGE